MDSDSLTSEVQYNWRRRQIGRPGKEDRAMVNIPGIKTTDKIPFRYSTRKNRWASGVSLWSEHKTRKLLVGGGSCDEAETQIVRFGNHRGFSPVRMSNHTIGAIEF